MKVRRLILATGCFLLLGAAGGWADDKLEKGTPEIPASARVLSGVYYRGDGLGMNITLSLEKTGRYTAVWQGCLGKYGEASGTWRPEEKHIAFRASKETGLMKSYLRSLDVMRFKGDWILVPTEKGDR